jgi:hypothetical protein
MPSKSKEVKAAQNKRYYEQNKEKHIAKMTEYSKTYYEQNKDKILARKKEKRQAQALSKAKSIE